MWGLATVLDTYFNQFQLNKHILPIICVACSSLSSFIVASLLCNKCRDAFTFDSFTFFKRLEGTLSVQIATVSFPSLQGTPLSLPLICFWWNLLLTMTLHLSLSRTLSQLIIQAVPHEKQSTRLALVGWDEKFPLVNCKILYFCCNKIALICL